MDVPDQAELVQKFMLAIAPEVTHLSLRHADAFLLNEELTSRRMMSANVAKLTLEIAVHLAAQAATLTHAATAHPTAAKDSIEEQIQAVRYQRERGAGGTP